MVKRGRGGHCMNYGPSIRVGSLVRSMTSLGWGPGCGCDTPRVPGAITLSVAGLTVSATSSSCSLQSDTSSTVENCNCVYPFPQSSYGRPRTPRCLTSFHYHKLAVLNDESLTGTCDLPKPRETNKQREVRHPEDFLLYLTELFTSSR